MHVGPSVGNYSVLSSATVPNVGFASPEFNSAFKYSLEQFRLVTGSDETYTPFILPGGGTVAMESAVSFLRKDSRVLIVSNGVFGDRWEKILARYPVQFNVLRANPGSIVPVNQVKAEVQEGGYDAVAMTQVETSTGAKVPVKEMAEAVRPYVNLVIVDGVASIGGERMNSSEWNVDVCLTASQKALGAQTGAGLMVASQKAIERLSEESISGYFLDLRNWLPIMKAFLAGGGGYFATPPIGTVFSLQKSFQLIEEEGLEKRYERHRICADAFRKGIGEMGLRIVAEENAQSNTVSGVYLEDVNIQDFMKESFSRGIEFGAGVHPKIKDRYFRVGHMGWVEPANIINALTVIEESVSHLGGKVHKGAALSVKEKFSK